MFIWKISLKDFQNLWKLPWDHAWWKLKTNSLTSTTVTSLNNFWNSSLTAFFTTRLINCFIIYFWFWFLWLSGICFFPKILKKSTYTDKWNKILWDTRLILSFSSSNKKQALTRCSEKKLNWKFSGNSKKKKNQQKSGILAKLQEDARNLQLHCNCITAQKYCLKSFENF